LGFTGTLLWAAGDLNGDGGAEFVSPRTCDGCTSNHLLFTRRFEWFGPGERAPCVEFHPSIPLANRCAACSVGRRSPAKFPGEAMRHASMFSILLLTGCGGSALDITGNLYEINYDNAVVTGGVDLESLLASFGGGTVLMGVANYFETEGDVHFVLAEEGAMPPVQDVCAASVPLPHATIDGDVFSLGPDQMDWYMFENTYVYDDVASTGTVSEDGEVLSDISMAFGFDLRQSLESLGLDDIADMCLISDALGLACIPCDDGVEGCVYAEAASVSASRVEGVFEPITTPYSHADCDRVLGDD
jgi:hypothetical protein